MIDQSTIQKSSSKNLLTPILETIRELEKKATEMYKIEKFEYSIKLEVRASRTIGSFSWRYPGNDLGFFFNAAYLATNTKEQIDEVIVHEFCHFLNLKLHGAYVLPHGKEWKKIMREFGGVPKPMSLTRNISNKASVVFACGCTFFGSDKHKGKRCCECGKKVKKY